MLSRDPTLESLLSDPLVIAVMKADRVDPVRLRAKFKRIGTEIARRRGDLHGLRRIREYLQPHAATGPSDAYTGGIW